MTTEDLTQTYQDTLENCGVPTNQAKDAAVVLALQNANPSYQPTEEELKAKRDAHTWMTAQGYFNR